MDSTLSHTRESGISRGDSDSKTGSDQHKPTVKYSRIGTFVFSFVIFSLAATISSTVFEKAENIRKNEYVRQPAMVSSEETVRGLVATDQHKPVPDKPVPEEVSHELPPNVSLSEIQQIVVKWKLVVDPHEFSYIHNPKDKCLDSEDGDEILLVIFVNSAPGHKAERNYLRLTFGNSSAWPSHNGKSVMRIVFLLGAVSDKSLQESIDQESKLFDDIVQEDFIDHYVNLTRKTVMGLKWVSLFCRRAKYTMKVDDDIVLNVPRLYSILQSNTSPKFTLGKVNRVHPIRTTTGGLGKWYTPEWVYPEEWYPPYLNGHAYVLSTDVAEMTYHAALETKLLPWSDVYVGECMQKLKIKLTHGKNFLTFQLHKMKIL